MSQRSKLALTFALGLIALVGAVPATAGAVNVASGFDTGVDGWRSANRATAGTYGTVDYHPTGGNPGGYISGSDDEPAPDDYRWDLAAASAGPFTGNLSANYGGTLSYDVRHTAAANRESAVIIGSFANGGSALRGTLGPAPSGSDWNHYAYLLNETASGWTYIDFSPMAEHSATAGEFAEVLGSVGYLQLSADFSFDVGQTTDIDNICLIEPGQTCPAATEPSPTGGGGGGGTTTDDGACDAAKKKLAKAKAKLKQLRQDDASDGKVDKAKKKVKKAKAKVKKECGNGRLFPRLAFR